MKFRNFSDSTSSHVEDKLKTIGLICRVIENERVATVIIIMNERGSNSAGSSLIMVLRIRLR